MDDIYGVLNRLKSLYSATKRTELCEKMGIGLGTYDTWRSRGRVPEKRLKQIAEDKQVRYEWLATGEGPKFISQEPMFLSPERREEITRKVQRAADCEGSERLPEICRAFSRISEDKQEDALKEVIATIAKYY